jgi:hypothetical protein
VGKLTARFRDAVLGLMVAVLATACTSGDDETSEATPASASASGPDSAGHSTTPSRQAAAVTPPELDEGLGESLAGRQAATRGNATFDYGAGAKGQALIVAVSCKGTGTIKVNVPVVSMSFPLECGKRTPEVTYNQLAARAAYKAGTVEVAAPSSVTWSVTVGRGEHVQEEPPSPQ